MAEEKEKTAREKLLEMCLDEVGYHPDEIKNDSDIALIAIIFEDLYHKLSEQESHSHSIS